MGDNAIRNSASANPPTSFDYSTGDDPDATVAGSAWANDSYDPNDVAVADGAIAAPPRQVQADQAWRQAKVTTAAVDAGRKGAHAAQPYQTHGNEVAEVGIEVTSWAADGAEALGVHFGGTAGAVGLALTGPVGGITAALVGIGTADMEAENGRARNDYENGFAQGVASVLDPSYQPARGAEDSRYSKGMEAGRKWAAGLSAELREDLRQGLQKLYEQQTGYSGGGPSGDHYRAALRTAQDGK